MFNHSGAIMEEGKTFCGIECHKTFIKDNSVSLFLIFSTLQNICDLDSCENDFIKSDGEFSRGKWFCSLPCMQTYLVNNKVSRVPKTRKVNFKSAKK